MDEKASPRQCQPQNNPASPHQNPTPEELYRAWEQGGDAKLEELLEQMTDEDEE